MACTAAVETLPPELMDQIFGYLVRPPPSASRLHDQPKPTMLRARGDDDPPCDLKSLSLVNKRWRAMTLPTLFRHVHWALDRWDLLLAEPKADLDQDQDQDDAAASSLPLLPFLSDNGLGRHVDTLTMVVGDSLEHLSRVPQGHPGRAHLAEQAKTYNEDNNWVWRLLFSVMDPTRITVIASPQMLASLLSRMLFLGDAWSFTPLCHILSLSREDRQSAPSDTPDTASAGPSRARPSQLFTVRPWTSLLLNEGSSVRVYSTYDFIFKRPPSILGALLGAEQSPNDRPLVPTTIRNLAYVGIFPLSSHFHVLVNHLPRLDRLFVQLVPRDRDPPAPEGPEMRNVLTSDLWMQRNHCYSLVMRQLAAEDDADADDQHEHAAPPDGGDPHDDWVGFGAPSPPAASGGFAENNWRHLRVFESGDAADWESWEMAVQYVRQSRSGWRIAGDGVFVKGGDGSAGEDDGGGQGGDDDEVDGIVALDDTDAAVGSVTGDDDDHDQDDAFGFPLFQGNLERVAFNGVARLPFSPATHYAAGALDVDVGMHHGWT